MIVSHRPMEMQNWNVTDLWIASGPVRSSRQWPAKTCTAPLSSPAVSWVCVFNEWRINSTADSWRPTFRPPWLGQTATCFSREIKAFLSAKRMHPPKLNDLAVRVCYLIKFEIECSAWWTCRLGLASGKTWKFESWLQESTYLGSVSRM